MKKFMTVLLVIAVMFTFSFSTAFAVTNTEANLIKQAADYAKAQLPEAVQKAYTAVVSGGTANTYITTAAWEAAAADIVEAFEDAIDTTTDAYLDGTTTPVSGWNAYDYVYAAGKLYAGYDYATLAGQFASDADPSAIMAAKEQFRLDLAEAMLVYDKVDLAGLYSTTAPTTGKTYYEQAAEAIETAKASLNKYFINKDGDIINVSPPVGGIANDVTVVKCW
ncbi:MAG: hypothetical protein IKM19_02850, partial [Firmicutes bacterium]|nr:hypothetical protein [Bacillota bacterium]